MNVNQVNAYGAYSANSTSAASGSDSKSLSTNDFLELLAAQMSNQDVMNPTQDTEFLSQMAQFTSLQATQNMSDLVSSQLQEIQALAQISYEQYGSSLVGKNVVVASTDSDGKYTQDKGVVESASFSSGGCVLKVNGKEYGISSVMQVVTDLSKADTTNKSTSGTA